VDLCDFGNFTRFVMTISAVSAGLNHWRRL
jgi:hypothetical protein